MKIAVNDIARSIRGALILYPIASSAFPPTLVSTRHSPRCFRPTRFSIDTIPPGSSGNPDNDSAPSGKRMVEFDTLERQTTATILGHHTSFAEVKRVIDSERPDQISFTVMEEQFHGSLLPSKAAVEIFDTIVDNVFNEVVVEEAGLQCERIKSVKDVAHTLFWSSVARRIVYVETTKNVEREEKRTKLEGEQELLESLEQMNMDTWDQQLEIEFRKLEHEIDLD